MFARKIPATVLTGFLGSGKTTMIRHLIRRSGGRRFAFIINEFGDLGVDRELIRGCGYETCADEDIVELRDLIELHRRYTASDVARRVLDDWPNVLSQFVKVMPTDYKRVLAERKREQHERALAECKRHEAELEAAHHDEAASAVAALGR